MEISTTRVDAGIELHAAGRLDGYWSEHLTKALDELLRNGEDQVCLRMEQIDYISSLGIRVLVTAHRRFKAVQGRFSIHGPTPPVLKVLEMAGLVALLLAPSGPAAQAAPAVTAPAASTPPAGPRNHEHAGVSFEHWPLASARMHWRSAGEALGVRRAPVAAADCHALRIRATSVAVGLGALGNDPAACQGRFGEFLSVAGAASCLPGDGSNTCDTLLADGGHEPVLQALQLLECEGQFSDLLRFSPPTGAAPVALTTLVEACLALSGGQPACFVLAAESAGLWGAALRRSPDQLAAGEDPLALPALRDWLSLTHEPVHARSSVLVAGIVAPAATAGGPPWLLPLGDEQGPVGHLHAAAFRFRPLPKGVLDPVATLRPWFEDDTPATLLHLLADDRQAPLRQSSFTRGACWFAPLHATPAGGAA
jgi:anti-anti-sigma factor